MIDSSKRLSLIQWFNALSTTKDTVQSLAQFADGLHFYNMVVSANGIQRPKAAVQHDTETVSDQVVIEDIIEDVVTDVSTGDAPTASVDTSKELGVEQRYEAVESFIDRCYNLESTSLVSYSECMNGKELELAKVAVLLMSTMMQNCLFSGGSQHLTTTVLQHHVQEDIREMIFYCICEDNFPLKKAEFHKILSRATARSKVTPRRRPSARGSDQNESFDTPKNSSKKRNQAKFIQDEIIESPLKSLLDSPQMQRRAAMFKKDAEISKLRNSLSVEEMKVVDLSLEKKALDEELEKKKKEIKNLKDEHRKYQAFVEDSDSSKNLEIEKLTSEKEKLNQQIQNFKEDIRILKKENECLQTNNDDLEEKLSQKLAKEKNFESDMDNLNVNIKIKDDKIMELKDALKKLEENSETNAELTNKRDSETRIFDLATRNEIEKLKEETKELSKQLRKEEEDKIKIEKLAELVVKERHEALEECKTANNQIEELKAKLDAAEAQIAIYKNSANSVSPGLSSSAVSGSSVQMERASSSSSTLYGKLWDNVPEEDVVESTTTSGNHDDQLALITPTYSCSKGEFTLMKSMAKNVFRSIPRIYNPKMKEHIAMIESMCTLKEIMHMFNCLVEVAKNIPAGTSAAQVVRPRRSRSQATEALEPHMVKINELEKKIETLEQDHLEEQEIIVSQLKTREQEIKQMREEFKKLQVSNKTLTENLEKCRNELDVVQKKYEATKKYIEKQKMNNKKLMQMYLMLKNEPKPDDAKTEACEECGILKKKLSDVRKDFDDSKCETQELKSIVKDLQNKNLNLQREVIEQKKEINKLEFRIQREAAFLAGDASARHAVVQKYFEQGLAESERKAKSSSSVRNIKPKEPCQILNVNTYILQPEKKSSVGESSMSSIYANRSIRSGFFQTDDEEDFLNHSSLAQIRNGNGAESESIQDDRLGEIQRRNTLCLPHLQSSYPLEIQNMTPSEKKYYTGLDSNRRESVLESGYSKRQVNYGSDSDESQHPLYIPLKRRRVVDPEASSSAAPTCKVSSTTASARRNTFGKPITPARKTGSLIGKNKPFKTPSSIRRLMRMPRKNKEQ